MPPPPARPNAGKRFGVRRVDGAFGAKGEDAIIRAAQAPRVSRFALKEGGCRVAGARALGAHKSTGATRARRKAPMRSQKKWGPALLPAPTAPSEGSAGVLNLVDRPFGLPTRSRSWLTSSGVASHLTFPLARSPADLLDYVARRLAGLSTDPAWLLSFPIRKPEFSRGQYHPMFRGPSWGNHSCVPLCSPSF